MANFARTIAGTLRQATVDDQTPADAGAEVNREDATRPDGGADGIFPIRDRIHIILDAQWPRASEFFAQQLSQRYVMPAHVR
jgi:hypothetical protein